MTIKRTSATKRWQDKRFYLLDWYKYAMFQIIAKHKKLSPGARAYGYDLLGMFGTKPSFPANLTDLARHCGITENTERKYRRELEDAKLFRFVTPPYWVRKTKGEATEIHFRTGTVTKWLRNHGLLKAKSDWVSRNDKPNAPHENSEEMGTSSRPPANKHDDDIGKACATTGSTSTTRKITRSLPKEVAAPRLADALAASPPPPGGRTGVLNPELATEVIGHEDDGQLGADYYEDGEIIDWAPATLERPADLPKHIQIGSKHAVPTRSMGEDYIGHFTVLGFAETDIAADSVLVRDEDEGGIWWWLISDLPFGSEFFGDWIAATETTPFERQGNWLGASVDNGEGGLGRVIGFPVSSAPESLNGHVLVRFTEVDGEPWDEPACWVPLTDLKLVLQSEPEPVAHNIKLGARVQANRPGIFAGEGSIVGFDKNGEPIVTPDCAPGVKMPCNPRHLEEIDQPNKMFDVASNVVHRNLAAGE